MIAGYQKKSNIGVGVGFVLEVAGRVVQVLAAPHLATQGFSNPSVQSVPNPASALLLVLGGVIALIGVGLFIWGCYNYCLGKGYSGWLGLIGLLSCIGLVVLVVLPDKYKNGGPSPGGGGGYMPPQPGVWPPPPVSTQTPFGQPPADPAPPRKTLSGDDL